MCPKEDIFSYLLNEGCLHCKQPDGLNKGSPGRGLPWGAWGLSLPAVTAVSCQDLSRLSSSFLAFSLPHWQFSWEFCCFSRMREILFFKLFQSNIWNFSGVLFIDPYLPVLAQQLTRRFCGRFGDVVPYGLSAVFGHVQGPWGRRAILGVLVKHQPISSQEVF